MALIRCPECGNSISDKAEKCPHCGLPAKYFLAEEKIQSGIDYMNLGNILISFDNDYVHLFNRSRYITYRDASYLHETYGPYYTHLKNKMMFMLED